MKKMVGNNVCDTINGKNCLVTGASSGIGREIALGLMESGGHVIMVCRDGLRGEKTREEIKHLSGSNSIDLLLADLSSQNQVKKLASEYHNRYERLDVLVNNAGVIMDKKLLTEDGIEMTFAVNYLAYFMLTNLLMDLLVKSAPSRVINMSSDVHRTVKMDFDNLQGEKFYNRDNSYAQSKLADIIFSHDLARRVAGKGVYVNCVCPGAVSSNIWQSSSKTVNGFFNLFMKGPEEGARLPVYAACSSEVEGMSGKYFRTRQHLKFQHVKTYGTVCKSSDESYNSETALKLWEISEKLTGVKGVAVT